MVNMALIAPALTNEGISAIALSKLLGWSVEEMATYLDRNPSSLYRAPSAETLQDRLAALAGLYKDLVELLTPRPGTEALDTYRVDPTKVEPSAVARTWFRLPQRALNGDSPKERILAGDLASARQLVNEYSSGLAA